MTHPVLNDSWGYVRKNLILIASSGLSYARARYFDSSIGRFISQDTYEGQLDNPLSLNLYTYVHNNPLIYTDPTGHKIKFKQLDNLVSGFASKGFEELASNSGGIKQIWDNIKAVYSLIDGLIAGDITWKMLKDAGIDTISGDIKYVYNNYHIITNSKVYSDATIEAFGAGLAGAYAEIMNILGAAVGAGKSASSIIKALKDTGKVSVSKGTGEIGWSMPKGGGTIGGRRYSEHALERMAPNTPEVRAELTTRANQRAAEQGLKPGTKEYNDFINKRVDPRGITPSVVEDTIKNGIKTPGNTQGISVYQSDRVRVVTNANGDVITVIPR